MNIDECNHAFFATHDPINPNATGVGPSGHHGTDYWGKCICCGLTQHHIEGKIVEEIAGNPVIS